MNNILFRSFFSSHLSQYLDLCHNLTAADIYNICTYNLNLQNMICKRAWRITVTLYGFVEWFLCNTVFTGVTISSHYLIVVEDERLASSELFPDCLKVNLISSLVTVSKDGETCHWDNYPTLLKVCLFVVLL